MKKIITVAAIALFTMTSCSDDDSSTTTPPDNTTDTVLVTQITSSEDGEVLVYNYTYDGNKIIKLTFDDGTYEDYSYNSDNKISSIIYYDPEIIAEGPTTETNFAYTSGQLTSMITLEYEASIPTPGTKRLFTHNTDGTISYEEYTGNLESQTTLSTTGVLTITNGNLIKEVVSEGTEVIYTTTFTFDNKNNPFKNIASFNEIMLFDDATGYVNTNNVTSSLLVDSFSGQYQYTNTNTYNEQDYPTYSVETEANSPDVMDTTVYTYNQ